MDHLEAKLAYLQHCVSENLNHARHVENERLTFTSIYIAMVIGAVAVVFGLENNWVAFTVSASLTLFGIMALKLNARWQGVFDEHMHKAEECQRLWRHGLDGEDADLPEMCYCYSYVAKPKIFWRKCQWTLGYSMLDEGKPKVRDLFRRTRHLFALLYFIVVVLLIILTGYLFFQAQESATGGGFYFSVEARKDLEEAFTHIVEEVMK